MPSESMSRQPLVAIDLPVLDSGRHGRAFLHSDRLATLRIADLRQLLDQSFIDDEDETRLLLLERALRQGTVDTETYPGEKSPVEFHAYLRAPDVSASPIFACVLAPLAVVEHLALTPPHVVVETAGFQVIDQDASPASITAGLEAWATRVWPEIATPRFRVRQWPDIDDASVEAGELLSRWQRLRLPSKPVVGAAETLPLLPASPELLAS